MFRAVILAGGLVLWGAAPMSPASRQHCVSGARAQAYLAGVRHLLSSTDSVTREWRTVAALPQARSADVRVVVDEAVCERAAREYAKHAGPAADQTLPFPVAVVATPALYAVELGATAGKDAEYWEVVIFSRHWRRLYSYGGGS